MIIDFINNAALLVTLSAFMGIFIRIRKSHPVLFRILLGFWFGIIAVALMLIPFEFITGAIFDGRSIVLSIAGLFGGGISAIIAALISSTYRIYVGGPGVWAGLGTIVSCASIGYLFRRFYQDKPETISLISMLGIGMLVHLVTLICQLLFPWPMGIEVIKKVWMPFLLILPVIFVIVGWLLGNEEKRYLGLQAITEAENLFRATLYSIGDAVITTDKKGKIRQMNSPAEKLTGWDEKAAKGEFLEKVFRLVDENSGKETTTPTEVVLKTGTSISTTNHHMLIAKNGNTIHVTYSGSPIFGADGTTIGMVVVFRDYTEERQRIKQIEESEELFRNMFENHKAIHLLIDPDSGKIINANPSATKFYGYSLEQMKTMTMGQINTLPPDEFKEALELVRKKEQVQFEFQHRLANGLIKDVLVYSSLVEFAHKKFIYSIVHDISERKEQELKILETQFQLKQQNEEYLTLNEELHETNEQLLVARNKAEESDRLKTVFLQNMSHEIRTPLNGILGFTSLLAENNALSQSKKESYSSIIKRNAESLMQIINDILDLSRLETDQISLNKKNFLLNKTLNDLFTLYQKKLQEKNKAHLQLKLLNSPDQIILFNDENRLSQVFINLLDNAIKFTKEGSITFGVKEINNRSIKLLVSDTGIGIDKAKHSMIFDRFAQADLQTSTQYGGTGLGLSIVKKLINMMEGNIEVESEPCVGSTFTIELPYEDYSPEEKESEEIENALNLKDLEILLVEDDEPSQVYYKEIVHSENIKLHIAENGKEALSMFRRHRPKIILMDIRLPDMNGLDVVKEIRKSDRKVKIIAQSAFAMPSDEIEAIEAGCNQFMAKPVSPSALLKALRDS